MGSNPASSKGIEDVYELTPIQQGLLFEQLARPHAGVYIEQLLLTFGGRLDVTAFQQAWQMVVDRHPILRSSFHWRAEGLPLQVVHTTAALALEVLDWRDTPVEKQHRRLGEWLDRERVEGFDLTTAPLMRLTVIHSEPQSWLFAWRLSHLLMDGWSFGLAITDFITCYRALCLGHQPHRAPMRPYRDYVAWWSTQDGSDSREFWQSELAEFVPPEPLQIDGSTLVEGEPSHDFVELRLVDIETGLRELGRVNQLTLNTMVQAAWLLVLAHNYGTDDVVCGFTMVHRPPDLRGSETILGPLIATMPVREKLAMTRSALSWLKDFQVHLAAVREHTTMPLFDVQRVIPLPLDVPLLESSVSYENVPMPDFALQEAGMELVDMHYDGRPHYPITMVIMPGDGMPLRVIYDRSRFSADAAQRFCGDVRGVLEKLVRSPELTLGELSPGAARTVPVAHSPGCEQVEAREEPLHASFAAHAALRSDHPAIRFGDHALSYTQLDQLSDAIAARVLERGADRVGLCMERSDVLVAAMIGTLKAGAAYVPLDPGYPADRLAWMLTDAGIGLVLTTEQFTDALPSFDGAVVTIDGKPRAEPDRAVLSEVRPETPAYVLYTSGSTGRPKGVVVTHRNVQSLLAAGRELFGFGSEDIWTASHSPSFDYSVWEIWGALGNGATLIIVPQWTVRAPDEFHELVRTEEVTVCSQTPTLFEHFAEFDGSSAGHCAALRHIFIGGDRLPAATLRPWIARHGVDRPRLYNLYGVTEAAVVSTCYRITEHDVATDGPVPIGWVLPNQRAYLLDADGRAVAPGTRGELVLAGQAVASGYHNQPDLSARRFGTEPGSGGDRLYRTGDLARIRADGALLYVGRNDTQVKIRGYRVELGEIEAALRAHPGVRSVVVTTRTDGSSTARLIGYAVPAGPEVPAAEVLHFAAGRLAPHMVPASLHWLPEIPTTVGGKIDIAALPDAPEASTNHAMPVTGLERELVGVLTHLLGLQKIGVDDELVGLGMHSAHTMRLMAVVRGRWLTSVNLRDLYACRTLRQIADLIERELE
jgi:surfactin family lipopeptide synthetase C